MQQSAPDAYSFSFTGLDGSDLPLEAYRGKALLVVNTASACGFTPQYQGLEELWKTYGDCGLVVLGVPSNDFNQETGSDSDIKEFCDLRYHVTFPMTAKTKVTGDDAHPFYQWIGAQVGFIGRPHWNFYKYLIGRDGRLVTWYSSITRPTSGTITSAIKQALA